MWREGAREIEKLRSRKPEGKRDSGKKERDLLTERNSVGLREGEVLLMRQREKSLGQREAQETGCKGDWFEIRGCGGRESGVSRKQGGQA